MARGTLTRALLGLVALVALAPHRAAADGQRQSDRRKQAETRELLERLVSGTFGARGGNGGGVGYLGDMGRAPAAPEDLTASSGSPPYSLANLGGVGMGYNGPYVSRPGSVESSLVDAWGMPIAIETDAETLRFRSAGPDRNPATQADNVYAPLVPRATHGTLEIKVLALAPTGYVAGHLSDDEVSVEVYLSDGGIESVRTAAYDASAGAFRVPSLHLGRHLVRALAVDPSEFDVSEDSDIAWLRGRAGRGRVTLVLGSTSGITVCHDPSGSNARTKTVTAPALEAHIGHGDTLGACDSAE